MPIRVHTGEEPPAAFRGPTRSARRAAGVMRVAASDVIESIRHAIFAFGPLPPRTAVDPAEASLDVVGTAGQRVRATMTVRNTQLAVVVACPVLTALRGVDGALWSPEHSLTARPRLVPAGESATIDLEVVIASDVPSGRYDGYVQFLGAAGRVPTSVVVANRVPS
jgi:hypothetical protein